MVLKVALADVAPISAVADINQTTLIVQRDPVDLLKEFYFYSLLFLITLGPTRVDTTRNTQVTSSNLNTVHK